MKIGPSKKRLLREIDYVSPELESVFTPTICPSGSKGSQIEESNKATEALSLTQPLVFSPSLIEDVLHDEM